MSELERVAMIKRRLLAEMGLASGRENGHAVVRHTTSPSLCDFTDTVVQMTKKQHHRIELTWGLHPRRQTHPRCPHPHRIYHHRRRSVTWPP